MQHVDRYRDLLSHHRLHNYSYARSQVSSVPESAFYLYHISQPFGELAQQSHSAMAPVSCPFRILIIGRANAGKTTILRAVCGSNEEPKVYNYQGEARRLLRTEVC